MNLVTNVQREEIPVLDRARMICSRMDMGGLTQEDMASSRKESTGLKRSSAAFTKCPAARRRSRSLRPRTLRYRCQSKVPHSLKSLTPWFFPRTSKFIPYAACFSAANGSASSQALFQIHPYRYAIKEGTIHSSGDGFSFMQKGDSRITGPLTSVEALLGDEE
jgi:hypothetical protein